MNYGIQLYSIRDLSEKDLGRALEGVAKLGYQEVEFAGFFHHSAREVTAMLRDNGLAVSGTHTGLQELKERYGETVRFHQDIGCDTLIIPWVELNSSEKIDAAITDMNGLKVRLEKDGIRLGYHNHAQEFVQNDDGSFAYDELLSRTELALEIDTYWAYVAGKDPVALMRRLQSRVPVIHIKDGLSDGDGKPLGMGEAPVREVYAAAREMRIPMVVESETLTPDGMTEAGICIAFLKSLEK
ncbi:MAG: sugar phosphate isomerase/epimerase [Eubacteriales bacterium]|nr:sugar phosphate isomerase/epimerase [Eubacteriales bacterium]